MNGILHSIYVGYISGQVVETPVERILDRFCDPVDKNVFHLQRTMLKIALYWAGLSIGAAATIDFESLSPLRSWGALGLICFIVPLANTAKSLVDMQGYISLAKRVAIVGTWLTLASAQAVSLPIICEYKQSDSCLPLALLISNLAVSLGLISTLAIMQYESDHEPSLAEQCREECRQLEKEIEELKGKINAIDAFVSSQPDLHRLILDTMYQNPDDIAHTTKIKIDVQGPDDWIGKKGALAIEKNNLEHDYRERGLFLERHPKVLESFKKHMNELKNQRKIKLLEKRL